MGVVYAVRDAEATVSCLGCIGAVIERYKWILDAFIVDFFVDDLYSRFSGSWQRFFDYAKPEDAAWLLSADSSRRATVVWPLSLLALRQVALTYGLRRKPDDWPPCPGMVAPPRRYLKAKKMHEVERICAVMGKLLRSTDYLVVDVGSGVGHLARQLHGALQVPVIAVDSNEVVVSKARRMDASSSSLVHVVHKLDGQAWLDRIAGNGDVPTVLVGLHACGRLSEDLIRQFICSQRCQLLLSLGCCYMRLADAGGLWRPVSCALLSRHPTMALGYSALDCACHAVENFAERLVAGGSRLKVHCYRATLEWLLVRRYHLQRRQRLTAVCGSHCLAFADYALRATSRLGLNSIMEECNDDAVMEMLQRWRRVVWFQVVRCLLATLVESCILLDRALLLLEGGVQAAFVPLFDPTISPRNILLLGFKGGSGAANAPWHHSS